MINGKELYDIQQDPGQKNQIQDQHPEVVKDLKFEYDQWWNHISDRFDQFSRVFIGADQENPVKLTCYDWHSDQSLETWNQDVIRARQHDNGFWTVAVAKDGKYEFVLRTYPKEEDTRLNVEKAKIKVGDKELEKQCFRGSSEVAFEIDLKAGETLINTNMAY